MRTNETLIRLKDSNNEYSMISAFYTEKPSEFLQMYLICKKNEMPIQFDGENEVIVGTIEDIEVLFGGDKNLPCIDVWIDKW